MDNQEKLKTLGTQGEDKQNTEHRILKRSATRYPIKNQMRTQATAKGKSSLRLPKSISVGHHNTQSNTFNINQSWAHLQTTGGEDEPNIVIYDRKVLQKKQQQQIDINVAPRIEENAYHYELRLLSVDRTKYRAHEIGLII